MNRVCPSCGATACTGRTSRPRSRPTLILFGGGAEVARMSGAVPATQLVAWVRQQLRLGAA